MTQLLIVTLNGLTLGALYFLVASGFSLIFGVLRVTNMAHGSLYLIGAYLAWSMRAASGSWLLAAFLTPPLIALLGMIVQKVILAPIQGQDLREALVTIGIALVAADLLLAVYGGRNYEIVPPALISGATQLPWLGSAYPTIRLLILAVALVVGILLWLLIQRTRLGMTIRAGIDDAGMTSALGININLLFTLVFGLGAGLAGLAGLMGGTALSLYPGDDGRYLLSSLVVVIIGGMGSVPGAALGALLVGLIEQYGLAYAPTYSVLITLALMVVVLATRPQGLLAK